MKKVITLKNIKKSYTINKKSIHVLSKLNAEFQYGKFYLIIGHSGSGKSTLINILGLMDSFDDGIYELLGKNIKYLTDKELSYLRMKNIGFIFQDFQLNDTLNAIENVMLPMTLNKTIQRKERRIISSDLLTKLGLKDRLEHFPREMSGGEQQRVAIARALANNPNIIVADEPTGNLDKKSEAEVFKILKELSENGKCVIVVSHSDEARKYADIIFKLEDGILVGDQ